MYVDAHGMKVRTHQKYVLPTPNPWGKRVLGTVQWMVGRERGSGLTGYHFFPVEIKDQKVARSVMVEFDRVLAAPMVLQCSLIRVQMKRDKLGNWDWVERKPKGGR